MKTHTKQHRPLDTTTRQTLNRFALELLLDNVLPGQRDELTELLLHSVGTMEMVNDLVNDMVIQGVWEMQEEMLDCIEEYREDFIEALEKGE